MTPEPNNNSPFLPFPRELRDYIYEYLFLTEATVSVSVNVKRLLTRTRRRKKPSCASHLPLHRNPHFGILNVSKSTQEEVEPLLYKYGQFRFDAAEASLRLIGGGMKNVRAMEMLQDVCIYLDVRVEEEVCDRGGDPWREKWGRLLRRFVYEEDGLTSEASVTRRGKREWEQKKVQLVESATRLIHYFAGLDSSVPRKRCVVETVSISIVDLLTTSRGELIQFENAICRLTGFQVVELKMWDMQECIGLSYFLVEEFAPLGQVLVTRLGNEERVDGQECVRCIFYPQGEQSEAAPQRRDISI